MALMYGFGRVSSQKTEKALKFTFHIICLRCGAGVWCWGEDQEVDGGERSDGAGHSEGHEREASIWQEVCLPLRQTQQGLGATLRRDGGKDLVA